MINWAITSFNSLYCLKAKLQLHVIDLYLRTKSDNLFVKVGLSDLKDNKGKVNALYLSVTKYKTLK